MKDNKTKKKLQVTKKAKHTFILQGAACTLEWAVCGNSGVYRW